MGQYVSPSPGKDCRRFPDLYQPFGPFVKGNSLCRVIMIGIRVAVVLFILLAASLQPGHCLTSGEIAYLKKAGVSDETIQLMIQQEGERTRHSQTGVWDVEDEKGNRSTIYRVDDGGQAGERRKIEQEKVDRAWEMLRNIIIDAREND